jgi:hypothetical protein
MPAISSGWHDNGYWWNGSIGDQTIRCFVDFSEADAVTFIAIEPVQQL